MSADNLPAHDSTDIREGDILFDCPHCGKNMAIEAAGAGLMVRCANCGQPIQVPIPNHHTPEAPVATAPADVPVDDGSPQAVIRQLDAALAMANQQIDRLLAEKEALQERRAFLEQMRIANVTRFEHIALELGAVQDALDRALVLLAEVRAEKPA